MTALLLQALLRTLLLLQDKPADSLQATKPVVMRHVTVVDVGTGGIRPDISVVVVAGRIAGIGAQAPSPPGAEVFEGRGAYVIPGLWDMHVHLSWTTGSAIPVLIANGVTGVRDLGGALGELDEWRARIKSGMLIGPRIVRVGPILNGQKFNQYQLVAGNPDETRGVVRALKTAGVDFIKIHRRLPRDSYLALVDEAKKQGIRVVGHIPMTVTPEEASEAGQASIEHTETLFEGTFSANLKPAELPDAIHRFRTDGADQLFALFVKNHTVETPTLVAYQTLISVADPSLPPDPNLRYVAASLRRDIPALVKQVSASDLAEYKRTFNELKEVVRQMNRDGVTLMAGTDIAGARIPGFTLHEELALLVESGFSPLQALQSATLTPARFLGQEADLGSVEVGKLADLVVLDGNPLDDIRNTRRISAVVTRGRLLRRDALDGLLREGEALATGN
jgi:imidazolonepropionase-like amidohydrolase